MVVGFVLNGTERDDTDGRLFLPLIASLVKKKVKKRRRLVFMINSILFRSQLTSTFDTGRQQLLLTRLFSAFI